MIGVVGRGVTPAAYRGLTRVLGPAVVPILRRRAARGREDPERIGERLGRAGRPRPAGTLVWLHAASVGEAVSLLPLIERLVAVRPDLAPLLTTGTVTSARLMAERLPASVLHQYVPVDRPDAVAAFLDHWRPDAALWVESEFWPNLVLETRRRGVPMALVNARMSPTSFRRWRRLPNLIAPILACFDPCLAQSSEEARRLAALGGAVARYVGNLKAAAAPLPADGEALAALRATIGDRPHWLAASTHPGEETIVAGVHRELKSRFPGLLTVIVPRHSSRGPGLADEFRAAGLAVARRAAGEAIRADTDVYLADTMGELGLFYRLADIVLVGGSLIPHGGQNPLEPARLGCALLHGRHMFNFTDMIDSLAAAGGARLVRDGEALTAALAILLADSALRARCAGAARAVAADGAGVLDRVWAEIAPFLPVAPTPDRAEPERARA